ncbi:MAG: HAMP domain-containing histidine kinase [Clostridiales Family XIII bacterium]|jgi:signal transduction histidine kinase|nr:HAMP domain-containing histidine kinase [Clostridiales Family XIII bacterium]
MMAVTLALALICLAAAAYIIWLKRQYSNVFAKLNKLFDDASNRGLHEVSYDERMASALSEKLLRYIDASKGHFADVQNERDKIKMLISDISHQTRTPVSNILLYSGLLLEDSGLDENSAQMAADIQSQAEKLKFLTDTLVKMSRLETGVLAMETQVQPVKPLISAVVSEAYPKITEKNMALSVRVDKNLSANFDAKWTKEAVYNILENAVKYTDEGGGITVTATSYEMFVRLDVADTGAGIVTEEYTDIFKRFYRSPRTRESDGIGVGLYLAREILSLQGGYIKVNSEPGKGSIFSVYIPKQ